VKRVVLVLAVMTAAILSAVPAGAGSQDSSNLWSGLVSPGGGYGAVTADVRVPKVTANCGSRSNVVIYVGLGGYGSLPFVQNGITLVPGQSIGVWSEVFDRYGNTRITSRALLVRPGDLVRLSIWFSPSRYQLVFSWNNLTLRRSVTQSVTNAARYYNGATADYVVERSWYPYRGSPLTQYGRVSFARAYAVRYGRAVSAYNGSSRVVTLRGIGGRALSAVVSAGGQSFTTAWKGCT
jgi:hypothetical protein